MKRLALPAVAALLAVASVGCATPPPAGVADLMQQPAERALLDGIRLYDDGQYKPAEAALRRALAAGLKSPRDRAIAHKLLAFITCTSNRIDDCRSEFRSARTADANFALSRSEVGHPIWGPVFRAVKTGR